MVKHFYLDASTDGLKLGCLLYVPTSKKREKTEIEGERTEIKGEKIKGEKIEGEKIEGEPLGIVQIVHGMCEHKERYIPFMEFLSKNGYICIIHDHRGHGESVKSMEDLGYFYNGGWKAMVEDIKIVNEWIKRKYPDLKITLLGHSMGSMAVRSFTKKYDNHIDKLVVCGSPSDNQAKFFGKKLTKIIAKFKGWHHKSKLIHNMSLGIYDKGLEDEGRNAWICTDPAIRKTYNADPLCTFSFTVDGFYNLLGLMQDCYGQKGWSLAKPQLPIFFISGKKDPCRTNDKKFAEAIENMKKVGYSNVSSKSYDRMRHEILNEIGKEIVWNDVLEFIK